MDGAIHPTLGQGFLQRSDEYTLVLRTGRFVHLLQRQVRSGIACRCDRAYRTAQPRVLALKCRNDQPCLYQGQFTCPRPYLDFLLHAPILSQSGGARQAQTGIYPAPNSIWALTSRPRFGKVVAV